MVAKITVTVKLLGPELAKILPYLSISAINNTISPASWGGVAIAIMVVGYADFSGSTLFRQATITCP